MKIKHCVILTGAGISAESGLQTFRAEDGLWENYKIEEVATPDAWQKNPELVLRFYNERRRQVTQAKPNFAHKDLVRLETKFKVSIITQNIDDLHERAGSSLVLHLHGEIIKVRSSLDANLIYDATGDTKIGDKCDKGSQLRPFIVWFGENVPLIIEAANIAQTADLFIVIGTSLSVYPAASLLKEIPLKTPLYLIDPNADNKLPTANIIRKKAIAGVKELVDNLLKT